MIIASQICFISQGQRCFFLALALLCVLQIKAQITTTTVRQITDSSKQPGPVKIKQLFVLKSKAERQEQTGDSVYALILHKIGALEFRENHDAATAIEYMRQAARINISLNNTASYQAAITNYYALGYYYDKLNILDRALICYDSTIELVKKYSPANKIIFDCRLNKAFIYFRQTDYQQAVRESIIGMRDCDKNADIDYYIGFLNQKAQALFFQNDLQQALITINEILDIATPLQLHYDIASALKIKGFIHQQENQFAAAEKALQQSVSERIPTQQYAQIAADYIDLGGFYLNYVHQYSKANTYFFTAVEYAAKGNDSARMARAYHHIAGSYMEQHNAQKASFYFYKAWSCLKIKDADTSIFYSPTASQLNLVENKDLSFGILTDKSRMLLRLYKQTVTNKYAVAALNASMTADSVITQIRHQQLGEQSKLFWRNETRGFYAMALELCFLTNNNTQAYYFMERSRAVLLADKLNELGATATLPESESIREQMLKTAIVNQQAVLRNLPNPSATYTNAEFSLAELLNKQDAFIRSLEKKYPTYYQYKYAETIAPLKELQLYLGRHQQLLVHYFLADTTGFVLTIGNGKTNFIRLTQKETIFSELNDFSLFCEDKQRLNNHYDSFAVLSHKLYNSLFAPLALAPGRIIICADNFLIPFEALCSDEKGRSFLLRDYTFSYAYSASYLIKAFPRAHAKGNFAGFAPVSFKEYLGMPALKKSAIFLSDVAAHYPSPALYINNDATRQRFMNTMANYSVVNVFSHAKADSLNPEPLLYMYDSVIHLADLQLLRKPATQLIILSACQTNAGKNATGEGIYSLARGFASVGIPAVAATIWKADEESIYIISQKFNEYISQGLSKDEALKKAKLFFLDTNEGDKQLPYYWANMVVMGNVQPVTLAAHVSFWWLYVALGIVIVGAAFLFIVRTMLSATVQSSG